MPRLAASGAHPAWDRLYESAAAQAGYVTQAQAFDAGYSPQLVRYYVEDGRLERVGRGLLRLVHFPPSDHEDLVVLWLWSATEGVFSHETALMLHDLSDALPAKRHMTVPLAWSKRRLRLARGLLLHFADLPKKARAWVGPIPVTTPLRTVLDCEAANVGADLIRQAVDQGGRRGLFDRTEVNAGLRRTRQERDAAAKLRHP
jgi:predicted transcriptional regulator of viral defense system